MIQILKDIKKLLVYLVGVIGTGLSLGLIPHPIDTYAAAAVAFLTAVGIYVVPGPQVPVAKQPAQVAPPVGESFVATVPNTTGTTTAPVNTPTP
jgi:hypothetical protein